MTPQSKKNQEKSLNKQKNLPELLSDIANVKPEKDKNIMEFAKNHKRVLIAFIAPCVGVKVSPVDEARASIGLLDEFGIDALIRKLKSTNIKNAYLLVNSPGGAMSSSYKIAMAIRSIFDNIITFVPHIAASGGTLLALTGDKIVMGPMSHLTPLDVQIRYKGGSISAATFMKFFSRASRWFEKTLPEEAPYPRKALADKLDPFLMEDWSGLMETAMKYVSDILGLAGYKKKEEIAQKIVMTFPSHSYVINYDEAKKIGLKVDKETNYNETWDIMRYWLSRYIFEQEITHCIRYVVPHINNKNQNMNTAEANKNEPKK